MVAGKVKMAMGLQKSPANPTPNLNPNPKQKKMNPDSSASAPNKGGGERGQGFSRSFGAYFPRASAQVQPRPPDVTELLRLVEELRERESLLKTEILEMKLLKESAAILPILEKEIDIKDNEIERSKRKIECLEAENESLRRESEILHMELSRQNGRFEEKLKILEAEIAEMKKLQENNNSSFNKVITKNLWKCSSLSSSNAQAIYEIAAASNTKSKSKKDEHEIEIEQPRHSRCDSEDILETSDSVISLRSRVPRVPKPPPRPSSSSVATNSNSNSTSSPPSYGSSLTESAKRALTEISNIPPPPPLPQLKVSAPPPPPYPQPRTTKTVAPPPPPPPPPTKGFKSVSSKVSRVPEVVEFYHSLMRRDSRRDSSATGGSGAGEGPATAKDMIGEIENRSAHLLAIKTDVETQGEFIRSLIKEVENAAFIDIEDVVPFVKWLDDELSYLVDERAVLKHFDWPEQKADTLREAAFGYCDLKKLESEVSSFRDDLRQPCASALKKMQSLFEKLEHGLYNLSRMRESATNRYKGFHIPIEWMLDSGHSINQIKLASVKLAMKYMKRVSAELETVGSSGGPEDEELIVQAVKFAFRVHQFAGGFDVETMRAFQELRCHIQCQNQQHQHNSNNNHKQHLSNSSRTAAY